MKGKIFVVGIGPGKREHMSGRALEALNEADAVVGYRTYTDLIAGLTEGKDVHASGMRKETERCREALDLAEQGKKVALVSSGDPGVYGMAGIMLEVAQGRRSGVEVEVVPGITSSGAAASILGAPLMHDHALISLSDLLTDWELIKKRLEHAALADFVICLYNPRSKSRTGQIIEARDILLRHRKPGTPVGIVRNAMREGEDAVITTLERMLDHPIDMTTVVIIGNSTTYTSDGRMITPRGYEV